MTVKPHLRSLKRGQEVWALIEECLEDGQLLINYNGDLVRVVNRTGRGFRPGQRVTLKVETVVPLRFKLVLKGAGLSKPALDVTI